MISKRGELTTEELLEIILAVAVVVGLGVLLYRLISPSFDYNDETARSYFDSFEKVIEDGGGSFSMWQPEKGDGEFYLAYFQNDPSFFLRRVDGSVRRFWSSSVGVNYVCVCYWDGKEMNCDYCSNLDMPMVKKEGSVEGSWVVSVGEKIDIVKGDDSYEVS